MIEAVGSPLAEIVSRGGEGVVGWRRWIAWPPVYAVEGAIGIAVRQDGFRYCPVCRKYVATCEHFGADGEAENGN